MGIPYILHLTVSEQLKTKKAGERLGSPALETTYSVGFYLNWAKAFVFFVGANLYL